MTSSSTDRIQRKSHEDRSCKLYDRPRCTDIRCPGRIHRCYLLVLSCQLSGPQGAERKRDHRRKRDQGQHHRNRTTKGGTDAC